MKNLRHPRFVTKTYAKDLKAVTEAWTKLIAGLGSQANVILAQAYFLAETNEDDALTLSHNVNVANVVAKVNESRGAAVVHRKFLDTLDVNMSIRGIPSELEFLNCIPCLRPCKFTPSKHNIRLSVQHFMESPRHMLLHGHSLSSVVDTIAELNKPVPSSKLCRKRRRAPESQEQSVAKKVSCIFVIFMRHQLAEWCYCSCVLFHRM
jgi:hypothetical protein